MADAVELLLVEDDEIDRRVVRRLLGPTYQVHEAATGQEALALLQTVKPSCVLLDYRLPDTDGLRLIPGFARDFIPVIVITGEERPEIVVTAMQLGAQNYLVKGHLSPTSLTHAIAQAVDQVALRRELVEKSEQLRQLASALTFAEQRERRRIAQMLHDHVQQVLHGIQVRAHLIGLDLPADVNPQIREHLEVIQGLIQEVLRMTRNLTVELSPPVLHREGLIPAFKWLANHMARVHNLRVDLDLPAAHPLASQDMIELLYQLVRELLFNVAKHAQVDRAELSLFERGGDLVVCVADHGVGFDVKQATAQRRAAAGFGLHSVHERIVLFGGSLAIESEPNQGTRITITVPSEVRNLTT